jgi:hypothetical protein
MAVISGGYQTYAAVGNREDLIDIITNISPTKTPVLSMTGSTRATSVLHEWLTDTLAAPTSNAQIEGNESTAAAVTAPSRLNNYCQIMDKKFAISGTQEAVDKAGRSSEVGYQTQKALKELATDIEYAFVVNTAAASGASATARSLKGLAGWVADNISSATANRDLTAAIMDTILQAAWADGGDPDTILCGGALKTAFGDTTNFPGLTRNVSTDAKKYSNAIDVYESNFGTLKLVLSHVMHSNLANTVFALEMGKFRKAWLRPIKRTPLAKSGDSERYLIVAECTLESLNEKASAKATQVQ